MAQPTALRATMHAGDRGSNPACKIFLFFFIHPLNPVFGLFSNIKPLTIRFTFFFFFSTANLALDLAIYARTDNIISYQSGGD